MSRSVHDFTDYRAYLAGALEHLGQSRRGVKSRFAEAIQCRPGYVTQVLSATMDLSADQASLASQFFAHTEEEADYFLLLVLKERAGTPGLRSQLDRQIKRHRAKYLDMKERFKVESRLSESDERLVYSSWEYLAVLTLISLPDCRSRDEIARRLRLSPKRASEVLEQLMAAQLITMKGGKYIYGVNRTHLPKDSPLLPQHHLNWRLQCIQAIQRRNEDDLHYSSTLSFSRADRAGVQGILIQALEKINQLVAPSKEELACSLCVDLFDL